MFPSNQDHPVDGSWQECWGYKFQWTKDHLTPKQLKPLIYSYDTLATEAVARLEEIVPPSPVRVKTDTEPTSAEKARWDLYSQIRKYASRDETIGRLWTEVNTVPEWVDWAQIERGQKVFFRYGGPVISALTFLSLLGGMGSARTVETLARTGGFDVKVVRRRLLETTQHTLNVHRDLHSIKPGGDGFADSVRIRLLHARVRRRILHMATQKPAYYDIAAYGAPINDLDSLGTISVFSVAIIYIGLPRQGIYLRQQEILDYIALWRYVAYLMGTPHEWMATPESAMRMLQSLGRSEIRPSKASADLANNIITGLQGQAPAYMSRGFLCAQTYWLNGPQLAKELDIERPSAYYFLLVLGQCLFFMATAYLNRSFEVLDRHNINVVRQMFYNVLLHDKSKGALGYTSTFPLKYLPEFHRPSTERGVVATGGSGARRLGPEHTALLFLVLFPVLAGLAVWCGYQTLVRALRFVTTASSIIGFAPIQARHSTILQLISWMN